MLLRTFASSSSQLYSASLSLSTEIPANLKLGDPDLFKQLAKVEPPPSPSAIELSLFDQYSFPLLPSQVPKSIPVKAIADPTKIFSEVALNPTVFCVALRKDIVLNLVRYIRHARRQPKKTKRMSEIRGSNRKPRPQKGQGVGQVGHRRNSAWKGGQKAMGPVIRDYSIGMNKKVRALGGMMTLAAKFREGNLIVVDSFELQVSASMGSMTSCATVPLFIDANHNYLTPVYI